jgi:asparagine synthase (glutamine-hydrolysing)
MCGIAGAFGCATPLRPEVLGHESEVVLAHRGPDSFGSWQENGVSLLHWRLAIIDLTAAGNQPMVSADQRFVLCYNGEVYNFQQLRAEIEMQWQRNRPRQHELTSVTARSFHWRGHSDTEVIVEGFALWGMDFLGRLNGMFALALYDRQTRTLYLTRDRAGIKPLYLWERNGLLLFASEAKFFFHTQHFDPAIDANGLSAFFTYGHCYGENHALEGVRQLEPGQVVTLQERVPAGSARVVSITRSCPRPRWRSVSRDDVSTARELRRVLSSAVARQLVADVPVGVLLSGGVDSSILTALTTRLIGPEKTMAFTLGYPGMGTDYDEIEHARRVAKHLGVQHYVYEASQTDLIRDLEQLVWHYDEPFADAASLNVFLISKMIRSRVTVALAGEGSDELFGGYRRYQFEKVIRGLGSIGRSLCRTIRATRFDRVGWIPRRFQILLRAMAQKSAASRYSSYLESEVPINTILKPEWQRTIGIDASIQKGYPDELDSGIVSRLCLIDQQFWLPGTYLEKSDKGGMAHSLEIRVPFLDNEVVEFANTLPDDQRIRGSSRKWLLKMAFKDLVPGEVFTRFKRGFGVPVSSWLRNELREYYLDHVFSPAARVKPYLQMNNVEACFRDHLRGARDYSNLLWQCLIFEIWLRHFERGFQKPNSRGSFVDNAVVNEEIRQANQTSVRESMPSRAAACRSDTAQNY